MVENGRKFWFVELSWGLTQADLLSPDNLQLLVFQWLVNRVQIGGPYLIIFVLWYRNILIVSTTSYTLAVAPS